MVMKTKMDATQVVDICKKFLNQGGWSYFIFEEVKPIPGEQWLVTIKSHMFSERKQIVVNDLTKQILGME
jgi:hypothetical protein